MDSSLRWLEDKPNVERAVMIIMLTGWIDASNAAHGAMKAILADSSATPVAEFDDDTYVDFRARRPTMEVREGVNAALHWEQILLQTGRDQTGRDLLLLTGPEPDMAWHRFTRVVGDLVSEFDVEEVVHLGAYPFATPHTRTPRVSITTPSPGLAAGLPLFKSSLDVPAGVASAIEVEAHSRSVRALGLWAQVPHYVGAMSYPAASVALLDGLHDVTGIVIDAAELRQEVIDQGHRLDELVAENDEHRAMVAQLEALHDATEDVPHPSTSGIAGAEGNRMEIASAEEIADEVERFLRDQK